MLQVQDMEYRVLTIEQKDLILNTERMAISNLPEVEKQMLEWKAPWRSESLEHYLNARWCMGIFSSDMQVIKGYFLAQPLLFFEGYTQNLWIEHMYFENADTAKLLIELAIKYGKDKHLQRVLFAANPIFDKIEAPLLNNKHLNKQSQRVEVLTTKLGI